MTTASNSGTLQEMTPKVREVPFSEVQAQLKRTLESLTFRRATALSGLLEYVVRASRHGAISERQVAHEMFGRGGDFDPATDPSIRVQFGRLRRRLESYYATEGRTDPVRISLPERNYTPRYERICIEPMNASGSSKSAEGKAAMSEHATDRPAAAVLPFMNLTDGGDYTTFCASLTDELTSALAAMPNVDVAARSSSQQFGPGAVDVRTVAQELGVDLVIEGSVKKEGDKFRITIQLVGAEDGFAMWSESEDFPPEASGVPSASRVAAALSQRIPFEPVAV